MGRFRLGLIPILAVSFALAGATPANAVTTVAAVTMSTNSIAASGAAVATFTVSAHLTSDQAITTGYDGCNSAQYPYVVFDRSGAGVATAVQSSHLSLTSGTTTDGTWTATVHVTSGWSGDWRLVGINVGPCADNQPFDWQPATANDPQYALHVDGTNVPKISYAFSPSPAAWNASSVTMTGRVTLADGTAMSGAVVRIGVEQNGCADFTSPLGAGHTTNSTGAFSATMQVGTFFGCVGVDAVPSDGTTDLINYLTRGVYPARRVALTAAVAPTRVKLGRYVEITGLLGEAPISPACLLHLQRYASGGWHNVPATLRHGTLTAVTLNGQRGYAETYDFHTAPPVRGNVRYRVYFPSQRCDDGLSGTYAGTLTPTLLVGVV